MGSGHDVLPDPHRTLQFLSVESPISDNRGRGGGGGEEGERHRGADQINLINSC